MKLKDALQRYCLNESEKKMMIDRCSLKMSRVRVGSF